MVKIIIENEGLLLNFADEKNIIRQFSCNPADENDLMMSECIPHMTCDIINHIKIIHCWLLVKVLYIQCQMA